MSEVRKDLELVAVDYTNDNKKATFTFLDKERREIREVHFNRQSYKDGKFVDDPEKGEKVDKWCEEFFGTTYDDLNSCIGQKHDIYIYDRFNSLFETTEVTKFTEDMAGQIYQTQIKSIDVDDIAIRIAYDIDGKTYESKMTYAKYMKNMNEWFLDPNKKESQFKRFEAKFGVPVEKADTLIGHDLLVECKKAFSSYYGDIKAFPKKK